MITKHLTPGCSPLHTCTEGEDATLDVDSSAEVAASSTCDLQHLVRTGQALRLGIGLGGAAHAQLPLPATAPGKAVPLGGARIHCRIAARHIHHLCMPKCQYRVESHACRLLKEEAGRW